MQLRNSRKRGIESHNDNVIMSQRKKSKQNNQNSTNDEKFQQLINLTNIGYVSWIWIHNKQSKVSLAYRHSKFDFDKQGCSIICWRINGCCFFMTMIFIK